MNEQVIWLDVTSASSSSAFFTLYWNPLIGMYEYRACAAPVEPQAVQRGVSQEKPQADPSAIRDESGSEAAKVWALQQHLKELRIRESAPKPVGPTVHAPMAALQLCADLEPRGYLR